MFTVEDIAESLKDGTPIEQLYKKFGDFSIYIPKIMPDYEQEAIATSLATKYNVSINTIFNHKLR